MQVDRDALLRSFMLESNEGFRSLEAALVNLEARPQDDELLGEVFRIVHTFKGNAGMLGLPRACDVAHAAEDLLDSLRDHRTAPTSQRISLLLRTVDVLRSTVAAETTGSACDASGIAALVEALRGTSEWEATPMPQATHAARAPGRRREDVDAYVERMQTMRVDVARINALLDMTGEVAISRSRVRQALLSADDDPDALQSAFAAHEQLLSDLQDLVMKLRMVPLGPTFRQLLRPVRDMALAAGKQAGLACEGEDVEVDMTVVEQLKDPLTHMIRNAIDHGIEMPNERLARGKVARGVITLRARHEGGAIVVEVADDGAGLDRARIAERARELGYCVAGEVTSLEEAQRLMCEPGFSTSTSVTPLSGRGVGLDVVRQRVERLRGTIAVRSQPGAGTTFTLRLPLTLAVLDAFAVAVATEVCLIPTDTVVECLAFTPSAVENAGSGVIQLRGQPLPYTHLRTRLGFDGAKAEREQLIVVRRGAARVGLVVDTVLSEEQTVIKPLGGVLKSVPGVAGCTVLGSGRVALILDVPSIVAALESESPRTDDALTRTFVEGDHDLPVS